MTQSTGEKRDWLAMAALGFTVVATATAEYELAVACGFDKYVAVCVPGALDVYVIRALRTGRDIRAAVLAMIIVNITAHLTLPERLTASIPVVIAVSCIAPLVLWRVHEVRPDAQVRRPVAQKVPVARQVEVERLPVAPPATAATPAVAACDETQQPRATVVLPDPEPATDRTTEGTDSEACNTGKPEPATKPLTAQQVADLKGVKPGTVRSWVQRDQITPLPLPGRALLFDPAEADAAPRRIALP